MVFTDLRVDEVIKRACIDREEKKPEDSALQREEVYEERN